MSIAKLGKKRDAKFYGEEWRAKQRLAQTGKRHTEETRQNLRKLMRGSRNGKWKGGTTALYDLIRKLPEYSQWRFAVFTRDAFACVLCGEDTGGLLQADHIKPFAQVLTEHAIISTNAARNCHELWDTTNGRTLCIDCHESTDTFGYKANRYLITSGEGLGNSQIAASSNA